MYSVFKSHLKEVLSGELPGLYAHSKMLPPGRRLKTFDHELSVVKQSSVLLLVYPEGDQLFICLTKRPSTMKYHPGQISFPGGKIEKDDLSAEVTALRETYEEIGVKPSSVEILGKLSDLYIEVSQFSIQPFLAWAERKPDFYVDYSEVDALILLPLDHIMDDDVIRETELETITGRLQIKYYPFGGEIIWGATAMILSELIEILKNQDFRPKFGSVKAS
jgi:8-oxo-dGTP pyrophosphatase MutT (NUDIX family)